MKRLKKWFCVMKNKNARKLLLLLIIGFNLLLWLTSSLIAYALSPGDFADVFDALWHAGITWMMDPGFYDPDANLAMIVLSLVTIITSMITFSGGTIAYVASLFSSIIDRVEQGQGPLFLYDHIVILNWNSKALELIADYRFDDESTDVVVLCSRPKEEVEADIRRTISENEGIKKRSHLHILVRQGEVLAKDDLEGVCITQAKSIIILSDDHEDTGIKVDVSEIHTIKTLMLVANVCQGKGQTIVVEVRSSATRAMIQERICQGTHECDRIIPLLPDEMMGRLIAQTILMPALNGVFNTLFSFSGVEFYSLQAHDIDQFLADHDRCIPIAVHEDTLFFVAENGTDVASKRKTPLREYPVVRVEAESTRTERTIVIFGNNHKLPYILDSLDLFKIDGNAEIHTVVIESNDVDTVRNHLSQLSKIDTVLILSSDHSEPKDYDSDVLMTLLMIHDMVREHRAEIVIELLNPRNFDIAQSYNVKNTIISDRFISHIITQLSKNWRLYPLYMDLLTYDSTDSGVESDEIYVYQANRFFRDTVFPVVFTSIAMLIGSVRKATNGEVTIIGWIHQGTLEMFCGDLDAKRTLDLDETDFVVAIAK